jgi:hypothetical protein
MESVNLSPNGEYVVNSREVKWNGWWGTGFLKKKQRNRRLRMKVSQAAVAFSNKVTYIIQFHIDSTVRSESSSECNIARCLAFTFSPQPISEFAKHILL